jgi:hypothetical protein
MCRTHTQSLEGDKGAIPTYTPMVAEITSLVHSRGSHLPQTFSGQMYMNSMSPVS